MLVLVSGFCYAVDYNYAFVFNDLDKTVFLKTNTTENIVNDSYLVHNGVYIRPTIIDGERRKEYYFMICDLSPVLLSECSGFYDWYYVDNQAYINPFLTAKEIEEHFKCNNPEDCTEKEINDSVILSVNYPLVK